MSDWVKRAQARKAQDAAVSRMSVARSAARARRQLGQIMAEELAQERRKLESMYLKATSRRSRAFLATTVRNRDGDKVSNPRAEAVYREATAEVHRLAGRLAQIAERLGDMDAAAGWRRVSGPTSS